MNLVLTMIQLINNHALLVKQDTNAMEVFTFTLKLLVVLKQIDLYPEADVLSVSLLDQTKDSVNANTALLVSRVKMLVLCL